VIVLTRAPSKPKQLPRSYRAAQRWSARVSPSLGGGSYGWCVRFQVPGVGGTSGCGFAGYTSEPVIADESFSQSPPLRTTLAALVLPAVGSVVVPDGNRIATRSANLPFGLRAVVAERGITQKELSEATTAKITPLDRAGRIIPALPAKVVRQSVVAWQSPGHAPPRLPCQLNAQDDRDLSPQWGRAISRIVSIPGVVGGGFVSCVSVEYQLRSVPMEVAVLLGASHPGRSLPRIPNTTTTGDGLAVGTGVNGEFTARRDGAAWVIVEGGNARRRLDVLAGIHARVALKR
jgi:hypothetical protein